VELAELGSLHRIIHHHTPLNHLLDFQTWFHLATSILSCYLLLDQQMIHGDLHSDNVLFMCDFQPILSDFGLSRYHFVLDEDVFRKRAKGLTDYERSTMCLQISSPEVLQYGLFSRGSDAFSLGSLLYEMFTGNMVFHDISPARAEQLIRNRIINQQMPDLPHHLPSPLKNFIQQCWTRYSSWNFLDCDLSEWIISFKSEMKEWIATQQR